MENEKKVIDESKFIELSATLDLTEDVETLLKAVNPMPMSAQVHATATTAIGM